jgi:hypothetical protein
MTACQWHLPAIDKEIANVCSGLEQIAIRYYEVRHLTDFD